VRRTGLFVYITHSQFKDIGSDQDIMASIPWKFLRLRDVLVLMLLLCNVSLDHEYLREYVIR